MKMLIGFVIGAITAGIIVISLYMANPAKADTASDGSTSFVDIEKINREALVTPLREAEKTISDKDIASYYHKLLENCGIPEQ